MCEARSYRTLKSRRQFRETFEKGLKKKLSPSPCS